MRRNFASLRQFREQQVKGFDSQLRSVKRGRRQPSQTLRNAFRAYRARLRNTATCKTLRQKRGTGDGRRTAAAKKARFGDRAAFRPDGEFQNISANRIRRLHFRARVRQLPGVARIPEMFENQLAVHCAIVAQIATQRKMAMTRLIPFPLVSLDGRSAKLFP